MYYNAYKHVINTHYLLSSKHLRTASTASPHVTQSLKKSDIILLVSVVKNILPAIGNEFVAIIKESSMASIIGVNELMFAGKVVVGSTYLGLEPYIVAAGFYFIMTFTLGRVISLIERRMKKSDSC